MPRTALALASIALLAACALPLPVDEPVTPISRALDGKTYDIHVMQNDKVVRTDALVFADGTFHSRSSRDRGYLLTSYTTLDDESQFTWTSTAKSDDDGTHIWSGEITDAGNKIRGELEWLEDDGTKHRYTYTGSLRLR